MECTNHAKTWKNERHNSKTGRDETKGKALGRIREITPKLEGTKRNGSSLEELKK
jgi:hypothetical protein